MTSSPDKDKHTDKETLETEGDRRRGEKQGLYRRSSRWCSVVVVLTPSSNLDDQVAMKNGATSQSLG